MKKSILALALLSFPLPSFAADTEVVGRVNQLLRGELSAVDTYERALEKVEAPEERAVLASFLSNHEQAASTLRSEVSRLGGTPSSDAGVWGTWAKAVMESAKIFGSDTALSALKEGEKHGANKYEEILTDASIPDTTKNLIRSNLLPKQHEHIQKLTRLIDEN